MIDKETLRFLGWIQRLTKASAEGFFPFSEVTKSTPGIWYDDGAEEINEDGLSSYPIVLDSCLNDDSDVYHHDIVSRYEAVLGENCTARAVEDDGDWWCEIRIADDYVIICDGWWYCA